MNGTEPNPDEWILIFNQQNNSLFGVKHFLVFGFTMWRQSFWRHMENPPIIDAATSSGILKAKQKLGRTFNTDNLGGIAFTNISKLTMCSA